MPRLDEMDFAETDSEVTSTQLRRWADETSVASGLIGPSDTANWLNNGSTGTIGRLAGQRDETIRLPSDAAASVNKLSESHIEGSIEDGRLTTEQDRVHQQFAVSGHGKTRVPETDPPEEIALSAPLAPAEFLQVLRKQDTPSPERNPLQSHQSTVPSLLDSILPLLPFANVSRLRACMSSLAVAYRQQELSTVHLQVQLRQSRSDCAQLVQEVHVARRVAAEERERAGFLGHALAEAKQRSTGDGTLNESNEFMSAIGGNGSEREEDSNSYKVHANAEGLSLSLAVLRGQALQRAAERIEALTNSVVSLQVEVASLRTSRTDSDAVQSAGYRALQDQVGRLSAELAQKSVASEAKVCYDSL